LLARINNRDVFQDHVRYVNGVTAERKRDIHADAMPPNPSQQPNIFSGMAESEVAFVEWKVPSFAFATRKIQQGYIAEATQIVQDFSQGGLPKERIWINVTHAVDGAWGIAGQALTNADLADAISKG
jgi:hypothetical protein